MTAEYSYIPDKKGVAANLRSYLLFIYAPWFFKHFALAAIFAAALPAWDAVHPDNPVFFPFVCGALISLLTPAITYFRYIGITLKAIEATGAFGKEHSIRLSNHEITVSYDKNTSTAEYRRMKYFFLRGDRLFLMADKNLPAGTIRLDRIREHEAELIACLRADGVKELRFWSFRRWWLHLLTVAILAAGLFVGSHIINRSKISEPECVSESQDI